MTSLWTGRFWVARPATNTRAAAPMANTNSSRINTRDSLLLAVTRSLLQMIVRTSPPCRCQRGNQNKRKPKKREEKKRKEKKKAALRTATSGCGRRLPAPWQSPCAARSTARRRRGCACRPRAWNRPTPAPPVCLSTWISNAHKGKGSQKYRRTRRRRRRRRRKKTRRRKEEEEQKKISPTREEDAQPGGRQLVEAQLVLVHGVQALLHLRDGLACKHGFVGNARASQHQQVCWHHLFVLAARCIWLSDRNAKRVRVSFLSNPHVLMEITSPG